MANQRTSRSALSALPDAPALQGRRRHRRAWVAGTAMVAAAVIALAWFDGGEQPLRPIAEEIAVPEVSR